MLLRIFCLGLFIILYSLLFIRLAYADENFDISTSSTYEVVESGITRVTQNVRIRNKTEYTYTPTYTISTGITDIKNLRTFNDQGSIPNKVTDEKDPPSQGSGEASGYTSIEISFPDRVVGFGQVNDFVVAFESKQIADKRGTIWEVSVPGLSDPSSFDSYNITLVVPPSFGDPSITKPKRMLSGRGPYVFTKSEIGSSGILILFGNSQYYKLTLSYHLENSSVIPVKTEVALPPETSYQDIRIEKITPEPENVYQDEDGNWLAVYSLAPNERKTIDTEIYAHVFATPIFDINPLSNNLSYSKYWEVNDPEIKKLASELKTPDKIYNFVVEKLSYDYDKVNSKNVRVGASRVLKKPEFAVCLEYTDLFIALARAAGIRSRSVEGYAHTQDSRLRPLSLITDVLHSWPQFYDVERKTWIMVDPTWGDTTRGMDYYNSFDFDHVAFVVKGKDSTYPVPAGGYKLARDTKDVNVSFSEESAFRNTMKVRVLSDFPDFVFPLLSASGQITVVNEGNMVIKNKKLYVKSDLKPAYQEFYIDSIPPYGKKTLNISFDKTPFLTNKSHNTTILFEGNSTTEKILVGLFPDYYLLLIGGVIIVGSSAVSIIAYKTWSLYIQRRKKQSDLRR